MEPMLAALLGGAPGRSQATAEIPSGGDAA